MIITQIVVTIETEDNEAQHDFEVAHVEELLDDLTYEVLSPETNIILDTITSAERA